MVETVSISAADANAVLLRSEGHFFDVKSKRISPAKLSRSMSAFANADGGELYVGIEDHSHAGDRWDGFSNEEAANALLATLHEKFPESEIFSYKFIECPGRSGVVLLCDIKPRTSQLELHLRGSL